MAKVKSLCTKCLHGMHPFGKEDEDVGWVGCELLSENYKKFDVLGEVTGGFWVTNTSIRRPRVENPVITSNGTLTRHVKKCEMLHRV